MLDLPEITPPSKRLANDRKLSGPIFTEIVVSKFFRM